MIKLSKRLQCIADMVSTGGGIIDVGTDHAYIPMYFVEQGLKSHAVAADINNGPITIANVHISEMGFSDSISTCLSDGLQKVDVNTDDSITIAGMGGLLIKHILEQDISKARFARELILQPQSEYFEVRSFLESAGFSIIDEDAVIEEGKFYFIMKVVPNVNDEKKLSKAELTFGPILLSKRHPVLQTYLNKQIEISENIKSELNKQTDSEAAKDRLSSVEADLSLMRKALGDYYEV